MRKRTKEDFKKEYMLFKGMGEKFRELTETGALALKTHRPLNKVLYELETRAHVLDEMAVEYKKEKPDEKRLTQLWESIDYSNKYFSSITRDERKKFEYVFENSQEPDLINNKFWYVAYSAFMSTESVYASEAAQKTENELTSIEKQKKDIATHMKTIQEKEDNVIKKYPDINFNTFKDDYKNQKSKVENLKKDMSELQPQIDEVNKAREVITQKIENLENVSKNSKETIANAEKRASVLKAIIEIAENNMDMLRSNSEKADALHESYQQTRKEYLQNKKDYESARRKRNNERDAVRKLAKDKNASKAMKDRLKITERIWKLADACDKMYERIAEDEKYASFQTMKDFHLKGGFNNEVVEQIDSKDRPDLKKLWDYTPEQFVKYINTIRDKVVDEIPAVEERMTEVEIDAYNIAGEKYSDTLDEYEEKLDIYKNQGIEYHKMYAEYWGYYKPYSKVFSDISDQYYKLKEYNSTEKLFTRAGITKTQSINLSALEDLKKEHEELLKVQEIENEKLKKNEKSIEAIKNELDTFDMEHKEFTDNVKAKQTELKKEEDTLERYNIAYEEVKPISEDIKQYKKEKAELAKAVDKATLLRKETIESIKANAESSLRKKAYRQGSHKNTPEYDRMILAQEAVAKWPNPEDKNVPKFDTMEEALKNLEKQATIYYKKKMDQKRPFATRMRTARLGYAKGLIKAASEQLADLQNISLEKQSKELTGEKIKANEGVQKNQEPQKNVQIEEKEIDSFEM